MKRLNRQVGDADSQYVGLIRVRDRMNHERVQCAAVSMLHGTSRSSRGSIQCDQYADDDNRYL